MLRRACAVGFTKVELVIASSKLLRQIWKLSTAPS